MLYNTNKVLTLQGIIECPFSRAAKMMLYERNLEFQCTTNAMYAWPVVINEKECYRGILAIFNKFSDSKEHTAMQWIFWSIYEFWFRACEIIFQERFCIQLRISNSPSIKKLREGRMKLNKELINLEHYMKNRTYLLGNFMTKADILLASMISFVDYLSEIEWNKYDFVQNWYRLLKSRPSFDFILHEKLFSTTASPHYSKIDF